MIDTITGREVATLPPRSDGACRRPSSTDAVTPASHYSESPRQYPSQLLPIEYPSHFLVKKVTTGGTFRFQHKLLYIANSLVDQHIGLEETDDGVWSIYFNTVLLATLNERDYIIRG
jgi:hypothetical protein